MINPVGEAQHRLNFAPILRRKVRANPSPKIAGLADVKHLPVNVAKQVNARGAWERIRKVEFVRLRVPIDGREFQQVVYPEDPKPRSSLQKKM
jgi:hypothetical protein